MIWILLIIYQIKHFLCDYPFQGKYMLGKFKPFPEYILPLLVHSFVHGLATFGIALCFRPALALPLGLFDMLVHFIVDRVKASPKLLGRFKAVSASEYRAIQHGSEYDGVNAELLLHKWNCVDKLKSNVYFWWALGADQMAHHLTHYFIIFLLLNKVL